MTKQKQNKNTGKTVGTDISGTNKRGSEPKKRNLTPGCQWSEMNYYVRPPFLWGVFLCMRLRYARRIKRTPLAIVYVARIIMLSVPLGAKSEKKIIITWRQLWVRVDGGEHPVRINLNVFRTKDRFIFAFFFQYNPPHCISRIQSRHVQNVFCVLRGNPG